VIALPNYMLSDKIATPNKAGTLKGVSPISSNRNVMVKVKDTASFIEAARAVHGDKYDYSLTVYSGSQKPITIICKKCGPVTLSEPGSHYRLEKKCGCRSCEQEATLERKGAAKRCNQCGLRLKYNAKCDCTKLPKKYKTISCRGCGCDIRKILNKPFCSSECRSKSLKSRFIETECCNCGKSITKRTYRDTDKFCCSMKCQNEWALVENRGQCVREIDWLKRSSKAKKLFYRKSSQDRLLKRIKSDEFWVIRKCILGVNDCKSNENHWVERKCNSTSSMLSKRIFEEVIIKEKKTKEEEPWSVFCLKQITRVNGKLNRAESTWVQAKCMSTSGNWRRRDRDSHRRREST
jgi:hypothetical protein